MTDAFEHRTVDLKNYDQLFNQCSRSNILQSAAYGEAKCGVEGFQIDRKVVEKSGIPIALYQILKKRLPLLGTVARINRGPLFLYDGIPSPENIMELYRSLYQEWVIKNQFYLQIAPNLRRDAANANQLEKTGFMPSDDPDWQSGWVSLEQSEEALRKGLQQKWRNMLNKSEKMETEIHPVESENALEILLREYDLFMKERSFQSTSSALIRAMYRQAPHMFYSVFARKEGKYHGAIIIVKHGDSATYLVGITSYKGRKANVNYLLLWNGLLHCRQAGLRWFDVGGINEVHTAGIAHFKKGLSFTPYRLVGEYEGYRGIRYCLLSRMKKYYYRVSNRKNLNENNQKIAPQGK